MDRRAVVVTPDPGADGAGTGRPFPPVDVLVVAGEPLWPPVHGGRIRAARLVDELARRLAVRVVAPTESPGPRASPESPEVAFDAFCPEPPPGRLDAAIRPVPRLGQALLFAQGYLAAAAPPLGIPVVVDFTDVEVRRMASLARLGPVRARAAHALELAKARRWEPRVARAASVAVAVSAPDRDLLSSWGARAVLVPHGADARDAAPSPADGPVTFVASFGYGPNLEAATFLMRDVWPRLHRAEPGLRLRLAGRDGGRFVPPDGVEAVGDPPSVEDVYREASVVVAPVRFGGGAQLKVTEALARGRVVVATPFSAAAAPAGAGAGVVVAGTADELARSVLALWRDVHGRHAREAALTRARPVPTWTEACAPLVHTLAEMVVRT